MAYEKLLSKYLKEKKAKKGIVVEALAPATAVKAASAPSKSAPPKTAAPATKAPAPKAPAAPVKT
jgi:hypothetical protein